jgi:ketosteroid isomerase-like protein
MPRSRRTSPDCDLSVNRYTIHGADAATGRQYEITGIDMIRVHDGKLAEHRAVLDSSAMRHQRGNG